MLPSFTSNQQPTRHPPGGAIDIVVEVLVAAQSYEMDLREECWSLALDQRAFGPRRIVIAFGKRSGRLVRLAHTPRIPTMLLALACCLDMAGNGAEAAVVFCDEPVSQGPLPATHAARWAAARGLFEAHKVHLVDWFSCDDQLFRSTRLALAPDAAWWDLPE